MHWFNLGEHKLLTLLAIAVIGTLWFYLRIDLRRRSTSVHAPQALTESQFIEIEDANIHYYKSGHGPHLILLHGIGASVYIWRFLMPYLAKQFTVIAMDLPGFGKSSKDALGDYGLDAQARRILQTLEKLEVRQAIVVGSSMGGALALWLAKLQPQRFSKIVALNPAADSRLVPKSVVHLRNIAPLFSKSLNRFTMRTILQRVVSRNELLSGEVIDAYLEPYRNSGDALRIVLAATALLADHRLPAELKDLKSDVLILWGEKDKMVPKRSVMLLVQTLPRATLFTHPQGGHHIMEDDPEWAAEKILEFLLSK